MSTRLAIISSHPIQHNAPMFARLAASDKLDIKVFYTWSQSRDSLFDKDFGKTIQWDIPLLEGYDHSFVQNTSKHPGPGSFRGIVCPGLIREIRGWNPDALLVFGWNYQAHFGAMRFFSGKIPVWFRGDSTLLDETGGIRTMIRRRILRWVYHYADYALYVGTNNRAYFLRHGFHPRTLFFAPHAIDNQRFSDPSGKYREEAERWRMELGIRPGETVVLFIGKFEPKKDPELLIRALQTLRKPGVHAIFTGNGALESSLREMAKDDPSIHFIPFQNQSIMPVVYRLGDILVLPSQGPGETWGLVVNEAMACGKAVLVSDKCGCAADLVEPGKNGFVFPSGDTGQCMNYLDRMTTSREDAAEMGAASLEKIGAWSFEAICRSLEDHIPSQL